MDLQAGLNPYPGAPLVLIPGWRPFGIEWPPIMSGGQWKRSWKRTDLDPAAELAKLNLPPGTEYMLVPFEGEWAWIFLSPGCEMCCTPAAKGRRRIYSVAGARSVSDRRLAKIVSACETGAEDDEST